MQGQRSIFDPFPEPVDLNQGSNSNNTSMDESDDWNMNILPPTERRLLNNDLSTELNFNCVNTNIHHNFRGFSNWDVGESSSRASIQDHVCNDGVKTEQNWSTSATRDSNRLPINVNLNECTNDDDDRPETDASWGLSCKRKTLEGGCSSYFPEASRSLNISSTLVNPVPVNRHEPPNTRVPENSHSETHFGMRGSVPYNNNNNNNNISSIGNHTRPIVTPVDSRNIGSRTGGLSSSGLLRNNTQFYNFVPPSESRNSVQDSTDWSRNGSGSSGSRSFNDVWIPQNNRTMPRQQRSSEFPPWTLFPSAEVESGGQSGHFLPFPPGSSSTSENNRISSGVSSQRRHFQPFSRSLAADIEGRQRLVSEIRQVLNAMRRGENLRAEDYVLFDPFINGVAELHDRHRDMRLDVDNMSYEELLALEERIGNVNTGLSEEVILKSIKQRKHIAFMVISTQNLEPCCICQENYNTGDNIGSLDCGHDFHTDCIKQWLAQKNLCPICKMTGLTP